MGRYKDQLLHRRCVTVTHVRGMSSILLLEHVNLNITKEEPAISFYIDTLVSRMRALPCC
jgi:hypothetical protein